MCTLRVTVFVFAAQVVLVDDSFAAIPRAVEFGRLGFVNLKKVCIYLLPAGSFSEMIPVVANIFLGIPLALSSLLMIVICMLTDVFASIALVLVRGSECVCTEASLFSDVVCTCASAATTLGCGDTCLGAPSAPRCVDEIMSSSSSSSMLLFKCAVFPRAVPCRRNPSVTSCCSRPAR